MRRLLQRASGDGRAPSSSHPVAAGAVPGPDRRAGPPSASASLTAWALAGILLAACAAPAGPRGLVPERPLRPDSLAENGWERDADLLHLDLELAICFDSRAVAGVATNRLRALLSDTRVVSFHAVGLVVEGVSDDLGRALEHELAEPLLVVRLAEPLARGEERAVTIRYQARPEAGLYFVESSKDFDGFAPQVWSQGQEEENRRWIPTWDYPNDRFTFSGRFRVGHDMQVVSNGALVGVEEHGGGERTWHYQMRRTLPAYLVAVAAGRWERYVDEWGGVALEYYVAPGTGEEKARRAFGETPDMMAFFTELLGVPYPYEKYAQVAVADFLYGGMENTTVTIQNDYVVVGEDEALDLDGDPRLLVAHELAHHWFGNLVTCLGWSHLWLNEAWASYLELLYERHAGGEGSFQLWLERYRERYLARGPESALALAMDWRSRVPGRGRTHHEYDKGPWVLHMLSRLVGEEAFWLATRAYLERHAEGLVTTADFQRAFFDATGRNVEGFFEQWIDGGGHPVLRVTFDAAAARRGRGALRLFVEQVQGTSELVPLFDLEVPVELHFESGAVERHVLRVHERRQRFDLALEGPLVNLVFDADCAVLCELEIAKPADMWAHQARLPHAGLRWRALAPLAVLAGPSRIGRVAAEALGRALREDPEPMLRARAAALAAGPISPRLLLAAALEDESAHVRAAAARALAPEGLTARERAAVGARLAHERSPRARAALERLLAAAGGR